MSTEIVIDKNLTDSQIYESVLPQIDSLVKADEPLVTALSNISAVLFYAFDKISWAGFYLRKNKNLLLGPFQGKAACTVLNIGSGVCGKSVEQAQTFVIEDVEKFPGHIACDAASRSEIVVPIINCGEVVGVLDIDSYQYSAFNDIDKLFLEKLISSLVQKFDSKRFSAIL